MNLVDSCGWLEYAADGPNAEFYARAIEDTNRLLVPAICIYEVFRRMAQQKGREAGLDLVSLMRRATVVPLDDLMAVRAAVLGIQERLPMADSIILACARSHNATLWTQDAHFEQIPGLKYRPAQ